MWKPTGPTVLDAGCCSRGEERETVPDHGHGRHRLGWFGSHSETVRTGRCRHDGSGECALFNELDCTGRSVSLHPCNCTVTPCSNIWLGITESQPVAGPARSVWAIDVRSLGQHSPVHERHTELAMAGMCGQLSAASGDKLPGSPAKEIWSHRSPTTTQPLSAGVRAWWI